jgi:hypothetical protein
MTRMEKGAPVEDVLSRIRTHRKDAAALLEQAVATAQVYGGMGLADSISYLARAHALLAGELVELDLVSGLDEAGPVDEPS